LGEEPVHRPTKAGEESTTADKGAVGEGVIGSGGDVGRSGWPKDQVYETKGVQNPTPTRRIQRGEQLGKIKVVMQKGRLRDDRSRQTRGSKSSVEGGEAILLRGKRKVGGGGDEEERRNATSQQIVEQAVLSSK